MKRGTTDLGRFLRRAREQQHLSLRAVEDASGVSNAYLSQLENGKIRQPSPVALHKLAELYSVSYAKAMQLAGYPLPSGSAPETATRMSSMFERFGDVTADEEAALEEYLDFLRNRRGQRRR